MCVVVVKSDIRHQQEEKEREKESIKRGEKEP
jgi:hypothetical protein